MKNPLIRCVALLALLLGHIGLAGCAATQEKHRPYGRLSGKIHGCGRPYYGHTIYAVLLPCR